MTYGIYIIYRVLVQTFSASFIPYEQYSIQILNAKSLKKNTTLLVNNIHEVKSKFTEENKQTSKTNMSATKKFTGAPVEEKTNLSGLFVSKKEGTMLGSVLAKMSNSKF